MKEKNAELKELMKKGAENNKAEIERVQTEILALSSKSMKSMPKMMAANMLVFLPLFGMVSNVYTGVKILLPFPLSLIWAQGDWFWVYVLCSLLISSFANQIMTRYEETQEKKSAPLPHSTQAQP